MFNLVPTAENPGRTAIPSSNGNFFDAGVDRRLAQTFTGNGQAAIVRGATQSGMPYVGDHYVTDSGLVYNLYVFGPTGNEYIDIYLPAGFGKPFLNRNASPEEVGKYNLVSVNPDTGGVLGFAHIDSINSQKALDVVWNQNRRNAAGSRYIGTIGTSGGGPGGMHSRFVLSKFTIS